MQSSIFIQDNSIDWTPVAEGMKRRILGYGDNLMLVRVAFEKGGIGVMHEHYHAQTSYVVSGKFEVTINGNMQVLTAGDCFYVPPHAWHGAVCLEAGELIDVFSPHREDFLKQS